MTCWTLARDVSMAYPFAATRSVEGRTYSSRFFDFPHRS